MKKILLFLISALFVMLSNSCSDENVPEPIDDGNQGASAQVELRGIEASEMREASDDFAFRLLSTLYDESTDGNVCVSPLSLQYALGMMAAGADGNTRDELMTAIGFDPDVYSSVSMCERLSELMTLLRGADPKVEMSLVNAIFVNPAKVSLKSSYTELMEKLYGASAKESALNTQAGIDEVNKWVNEVTGGKIADILTSQDEIDVLMLNAIAFRGEWEFPFIPFLRLGWFNNPDGSRTLTKVLQNSYSYNYGVDSRFKRVYVPIGRKGRYRLELYMPIGDEKLSDALKEMTPARLAQIPDYVSENKDGYEIILAMPRVDAYTEYNMEKIFQGFGVNDAFDQHKADFSPMTDVENLKLVLIRQKNSVKFTEWGVEAATVTAAADLCGDNLGDLEFIEFYLLHPFIYILREVESNCILYIGSVSSVEEYVAE